MDISTTRFTLTQDQRKHTESLSTVVQNGLQLEIN